MNLAIKNNNKQYYAIKTIKKNKILENSRNILAIQREIQILRKINHDNIIKLYEVYENEFYIHLVLEYVSGGNLLEHISERGKYSEKDASIIVRWILSALAYCHARNILHRDLKPENIIMK